MIGWVISGGLFLGAVLFPKKSSAALFGSAQKVFGPFLPAGGLPVNNQDLDTLARTIWGEARGEGAQGMQAVANVIMNRYKQRPRFGRTVHEICRRPGQFSCWNTNDENYKKLLAVTESNELFREAVKIAKAALQYRLADLTGGANHYLNIAETKRQRGGTLPDWVDMRKKTAALGAHTFLRLA